VKLANNRSLKSWEEMQFAGGSACATNGKSFACIGGACFSFQRPLAGAFFLSFRRSRLGSAPQ
jgi:hypothetical protein